MYIYKYAYWTRGGTPVLYRGAHTRWALQENLGGTNKRTPPPQQIDAFYKWKFGQLGKPVANSQQGYRITPWGQKISHQGSRVPCVDKPTEAWTQQFSHDLPLVSVFCYFPLQGKCRPCKPHIWQGTCGKIVTGAWIANRFATDPCKFYMFLVENVYFCSSPCCKRWAHSLQLSTQPTYIYIYIYTQTTWNI